MEIHHHPPDDIILIILSKLPTKSLCRSKCLSKLYLPIIENSIFRPKISLQWTSPPSKQHGDTLANIHIYSVDNDNGLSTVLQTYKPPSGTFFLRQYNGFICSYTRSSGLTLFNTLTQDSITVSFPIIDEYVNDPYRNFEVGFDPLSRKYKVFTYQVQKRWDQRWVPRNFEVLTLGEGTPIWRKVNDTFFLISSISNWVTIVDERIFWFDEEEDEDMGFDLFDDCGSGSGPSDHHEPSEPLQPQIISFSFTEEKLTRIKVPGKQTNFEYNPLFEFEGSLCFVETLENTLEQGFQWELNLWMLKDITESCWMLMKTISVSLSGINRYLPMGAEFSVQNGEFFIVMAGDVDQYIFSHNFLNGECKRVKIIGEPISKRMKIIEQPLLDSDSDNDMWF